MHLSNGLFEYKFQLWIHSISKQDHDAVNNVISTPWTLLRRRRHQNDVMRLIELPLIIRVLTQLQIYLHAYIRKPQYSQHPQF